MRHTAIINTWIYVVYFSLLFIGCQKQEHVIHNEEGMLPVNGKVVTVLGSSTARGQGAVPIDSSWVNQLQQQFLHDFRNVKVVNLAMSGYATFDILPCNYATADTNRNIDKALSYKPNLIIINLPSNDMAKGFSDQEILKNYEVITKSINAANIPFIIISTQPRNFPDSAMRKRLMLFNDKLNAVYPKHIVDVYSKLSTPDFFINAYYGSGDGIHLNNKGHRLIFQTVSSNAFFRSIFY